MSDNDLLNRMIMLERQVAAMKARAEERHAREKRIEDMVQELRDDMHARRGREAAEKREHVESREDRDYWARWVQHLLPSGLWVALFTGLTALWNWLRNGGQ